MIFLNEKIIKTKKLVNIKENHTSNKIKYAFKYTVIIILEWCFFLKDKKGSFYSNESPEYIIFHGKKTVKSTKDQLILWIKFFFY